MRGRQVKTQDPPPQEESKEDDAGVVEVVEIALNFDHEEDIHEIYYASSNPKMCPCLAVSQSKRKSIEVSLKKLSRKELEQFKQAMDKEMQGYISQDVLK